MLEKRTFGNAAEDNNTEESLVRYIYSNHLQSANLELDEAGAIISYEEYHPYGTTSFQAANATIKAVAKRYRYTGKERDEESGLYYHGASVVIKTVYAELTIVPHAETAKEAEAIASTIFGRLYEIETAREKHKESLKKVEEAKLKRESAMKKVDEIGKYSYRKELLKEGIAKSEIEKIYKQRLDAAQAAYKNATKELSDSQTESINLKTALDKVEKATIPADKIGKTITLTDIVSQKSQYEGFPKGKKDFKNFMTFTKAALKDHRTRYDAAVKAVLKLAKDPSKILSYRSFKGGNLRPNGALTGETKIGGNYFTTKY